MTRSVAGWTGPPGNRHLYAITSSSAFRRGGVGIVYEAWLTADRFGFPAGTKVGLKLLTGVDAERFAKLSNRTLLLRDHPHPYLARVIESFVGPPLAPELLGDEDANLNFSAHVWAEGESLSTRVNRAPVEQIVGWITDVAAAVDHLHALPGGFAHRDIHGRNIIVRSDGHACLIDFDTILWGEGHDTVLTSLSSAPRPVHVGGTSYAQSRDRSMLALTLLRALARDTDGTAPLAELAHDSLANLADTMAGAARSPRVANAVVGSLLRAIRQPPAHAGDLVAGVRDSLSGKRRVHRFDPQAELARLEAEEASSLRRGGGKRVLAGLVVAVVALMVAVSSFVFLNHEPSQGRRGPAVADVPVRIGVAAASVTTGQNASCMIESSRRSLWCWGTSADASSSVQSSSVPAWVAPLRDVRAVAVGAHHRCVITARHRVDCWGSNDHGQLGIAVNPNYSPGYWHASPSDVGLSGATALAAAGDSTCAVADPNRSVYCWGTSMLRASNAVPVDVERPTLVSGLTGIFQLSIEQGTGCGVDGAGTVICWGLGNDYSHPEPKAVAGLPPATSVALGGASVTTAGPTMCVVTRALALDCLGRAPWLRSVRLDTGIHQVTAFGPVTQVGLGSGFMCVLTASSKVSCAGDNSEGQLGRTHTSGDSQQSVPGMSGVTALSVNTDHTCVTKADHTVWCWGSNIDQQVASADQGVALATPTQVTVAVPRDTWRLSASGLGPLRLGMTPAHAAATGLVIPVDASGDMECPFSWAAAPGLDAAHTGVSFSKTGLAIVSLVSGPDNTQSTLALASPAPAIVTSRGIGLDSSVTQLKAAYGERLRRATLPRGATRFVGAGAGRGYITIYVEFGQHGALVFEIRSHNPTIIEAIEAVSVTNMRAVIKAFGACPYAAG